MGACTCQGGENQPGGVQLRANDCPMHGEYGRCACGNDIEPDRASWADTCEDCMAQGCPKSPEDALAGDPCDACDCVAPDLWDRLFAAGVGDDFIIVLNAPVEDHAMLLPPDDLLFMQDAPEPTEHRANFMPPLKHQERMHPKSPRETMRHRRRGR